MRHQGDWKKANMEQAETRQLSRPYTTILFCYGGLSLLLAVGLNAAIPDLERGCSRTFVSTSMFIYYLELRPS